MNLNRGNRIGEIGYGEECGGGITIVGLAPCEGSVGVLGTR